MTIKLHSIPGSGPVLSSSRCSLRSVGFLVAVLIAVVSCRTTDAESPVDSESRAAAKRLFARPNLVAWCIVPFDAAKRNPEQRSDMISELDLRRVAYDWREEHVPSFEEEILQYKKHGIEFFAFWNWHDSMEPLVREHGIRPQIWITVPSPDGASQQERIESAASQLLPLVDKTRSLGLKLGLYNHGGWGGQPANMVAVCDYLREHQDGGHVGIVYNFHHAHHDLTDFGASFSKMKPYLLCLNLNGMADPSTVNGNVNKILPIGEGKYEREMMQVAVQQGYDGPIGILDHRNDTDARKSLQENLDGLDRIVEAWK